MIKKYVFKIEKRTFGALSHQNPSSYVNYAVIATHNLQNASVTNLSNIFGQIQILCLVKHFDNPVVNTWLW